MAMNAETGGTARQVSLSVLVPIYNERYLARASLDRLRLLGDCELLSQVQVIVVDDGSTDGTAQELAEFERSIAAEQARNSERGKLVWRFIRQARNMGKGAAIRAALEHATCDVSVIHDADLEYHPRDLIT